MTVLVPSLAFAQARCEQLFSQTSAVGLRIPLKITSGQEARNKYWEEQFSRLENFEQLNTLTISLERSLKYFSASEVMALQRVDLIKMAKRFSLEDQERLKVLVLGIAIKGRYDQQISPIANWLLPLQMHFEPAKSIDFVNRIRTISNAGLHFAEAFSGYHGLRAFNQTMISALGSLPPEVHHKILQNLRDQMASIRLEDEVMSMQGRDLIVPQVRLYRRNIEMISSLVNQREFVSLKSSLSQPLNRRQIIRTIDDYYKRIGRTLAPGRGDYSFDKVLAAAEILRKNMSSHLSSSDNYIEMYGSFTNGKAAFVTSDVDIKFSDHLLSQLTGKPAWQMKSGPFSLYFGDMVAREKENLSTEFKQFLGHYKLAEKQIGRKIFVRKPQRDSELLTSLYPPKDYTNNAIDFRWYNPLVMRVYQDRVAIQLVDLNGSPEILEVNIPQN